jgi:transposase
VTARWLRSIPGIGDFSALLLLAELGDAGRFRDKEAVANYAGLVPWVRESADRSRRGSITRCGSPWLRWIMVEAVPRAVWSSPAVRRCYDRLRARKHAHVARVAVARKLLIAAWALLRDGVLFDEARFA